MLPDLSPVSGHSCAGHWTAHAKTEQVFDAISPNASGMKFWENGGFKP